MLAVLAEDVVPRAVLRHGAGVLALDLADRAADVARDHSDLEAELPHGELHLLDALFGVVQRDQRRGRHARRIGAVGVGDVLVVGAAADPAKLFVGQAGIAQAPRGVERAEVQPQVVKTLGEEAGDHGGGPVEAVLSGSEPPGDGGRSRVAPLVGGELRPVLEVRVLLDPLEDALPALGADVVVQDGRHLDEVAVGVDYRVVQLCANRRRLARNRRHDFRLRSGPLAPYCAGFYHPAGEGRPPGTRAPAARALSQSPPEGERLKVLPLRGT